MLQDYGFTQGTMTIFCDNTIVPLTFPKILFSISPSSGVEVEFVKSKDNSD